MSSPRRRGRRIPPKARGPRPIDRTGDAYSSAAEPAAAGSPAAGDAAPVRRATRAQNRAVKRAATERTRPVRRGGAGGRRGPSNLPLIVLAIAAVAIGGAVIAFGNPFGSPAASASASPGGSATPAPSRSIGSCPTSAPAGLAAGEKRTVTIATSKGAIVIEVDANLAPVAAANFVTLAECGYYDGVVFHRVVPDFVVQGGDGQYGWIGNLDRSRVGGGDPGYEFADEPVNGEYTRGTVAMANSGPDTNGSQFFICTADLAGRLGKDYTIFGHVTTGMDVVDQIVSAPRNEKDLPDEPVAMASVTVSTPAPSASPAASSDIQGSPTTPPAQ